MSSIQQSKWFLTASDASRAVPKIFCFTHAGGDSRQFLSWQSRIPEGEIIAVCPPGRAHRAAEPRPASVAELADGAAAAIAAAADQPTYLFGHSLGAVVAFEVARRLRDQPALCHLVASGCAAPALLPSSRVVAAAGLEGRAFAEAVGFFGGLPPEIVAAEELYDILLPSLQADFRMVARYQYQPARPLAIPVTLIDGYDDPHVTDSALSRWADETTFPLASHWVTGGHFYFEQKPQAITELLNNLLRDNAANIPAFGHTDMLI